MAGVTRARPFHKAAAMAATLLARGGSIDCTTEAEVVKTAAKTDRLAGGERGR